LGPFASYKKMKCCEYDISFLLRERNRGENASVIVVMLCPAAHWLSNPLLTQATLATLERGFGSLGMPHGRLSREGGRDTGVGRASFI
jgi:hypothetical protein